MENNKKLEEMTLEELKALAWDNLRQLEKTQQYQQILFKMIEVKEGEKKGEKEKK